MLPYKTERMTKKGDIEKERNKHGKMQKLRINQRDEIKW